MVLIQDLTAGVPALGDFLALADIDDSNEGKRVTFQQTLDLYDSFASTTNPKTFQALNTGHLIGNEFDIIIGGTGATEGGAFQFGSGSMGIRNDSFIAGSLEVGGTIIIANESTPIGNAEYMFADSAGFLNFGLATPTSGLGAYLSTSLLIAGPSAFDDDIFTASFWGFTRLNLDTATTGADLGVQNDFQVLGTIFGEETVYLQERAAAIADISGYGQFWVQNTTPNLPMFTDDVGTDFRLASYTGTPTTAEILIANVSGVFAPQSMGGDTTIDAGGIVTIANNAITDAKVNTAAAIQVSKLEDGTAFQRIRTDSAGTSNEFFTETTTIDFTIDGGGSAITTGIKGHKEVTFDCEIVAARLFADQTGSIVVDINKDTFANYPPTAGDSITSATPPTISSDDNSEDTTLTGWTTVLNAGDILQFEVDSAATIEFVTVSLTVNKRG